jgi:hypothetical protein
VLAYDEVKDLAAVITRLERHSRLAPTGEVAAAGPAA